MNLHGKNILITGAAKRIGREIALTLAQAGANIIIHYHQSQKQAKTLAREIEQLGRETYLCQADFSTTNRELAKGIQQFARKVYQAAGRVDGLVNSAAIFYPTPFGKIQENDWDNFLTVNLKAPFFLSQEIGKKMLAQRSGKIVNIVDWTAYRPKPNFLPYDTAKAGLVAVTQGLALELAPHVQVNCVAPGAILRPEKASSRTPKVLEKTLLKRWGSPIDIARTVRFLMEDGDYITGAYIPVDGGASIA